MSQENVEIVKAVFDAWNAGDLDRLLDQWDPNIVHKSAEGWPEPGPFVGREAVMGWFEQLRETWDSDTLEPIDFTAVADHVVVRLRWRGVVEGAEPSMEFTGVYTVRRGKVVFVELFWDHAEALEAVGLSE
jgi:ketosteroid isomerase-like protein